LSHGNRDLVETSDRQHRSPPKTTLRVRRLRTLRAPRGTRRPCVPTPAL